MFLEFFFVSFYRYIELIKMKKVWIIFHKIYMDFHASQYKQFWKITNERKQRNIGIWLVLYAFFDSIYFLKDTEAERDYVCVLREN